MFIQKINSDELTQNQSEDLRSRRRSDSTIANIKEKVKSNIANTRTAQLVKSLLEDSQLGSNHNLAIAKIKEKSSSILDATKKSLSTSASNGFSIFSLFSPQQSAIQNGTNLMLSELIASSTTFAPQIDSKTKQLNANDEENIGSKSGLIVQPENLVNNDSNKKGQKFSHNVITIEQRKETSELRKLIHYAVKNNLYVHTSADVYKKDKSKSTESISVEEESNIIATTKAPVYFPFAPIFSFWNSLIDRRFRLGSEQNQTDDEENFEDDENFELGSIQTSEQSQTNNKQIVSTAPSAKSEVDDVFSDVEASNEQAVKQMMAKIAVQTMNDGIISNTVESYATGNGFDEPQVELSQVRDTLAIESVTEDLQFKIKNQVVAWQTLKRNSRESHALIGITNTSVLLVFEKNGVYTLRSEVPLLSTPTFFTTFTYWNQTQKSIDGIVIISVQHELFFLRVNEALDSMIFIWRWPTIQLITFIKHFVVDSADMLLLINDDSLGASSANIYRFDMNQHQFYLRESLNLKTETKSAAHIQNGHETFLCFPQKSHVAVYKYSGHRFKYYSQISAANVTTLSAFEMGGHSYIAVGGNQPKILRYHRGAFHDQTILSQSWGYVEYFLPISARTYRDDLILLVQHRIDFVSHSIPILEALIWNGDAFDPALTIPCFISNRQSEIGLGCLLDAERELGIYGAAVIQRNKTISIVIPRHDAQSGLFDLKIKLLQAEYTYNEHLLELFSEVYVLLGMRDEILNNAKEVVETFSSTNIAEITIANQNLESIITHEADLGETIPAEGVFYMGELITNDTVNEFVYLLAETQANIDKLLNTENREKRTVEDFEGIHQIQSVNVKNLLVDFINDIPVEEFIFIEDSNLHLKGNVVLTQPIDVETIEERQNDENLGVSSNDELMKEAAQSTERLNVSETFFDEINGIVWRDFINEIVLKNMPNELDEIEISDVSN